MKRSIQLNKIPLLFVLITAFFYGVFAYDLERNDFIKLITLYGALFFSAFKIIQLFKLNFNFLIGVSILFRLIFLFALPNLSQDYFRFIWDGRLLLQGLNPYLTTAAEWLNVDVIPVSQAQELIAGMGSLNAGHFSNYPPINQLCFAIAALFSPNGILGSVMAMRLLIIAADVGTLIIGRNLLRKIGLPEHQIFWYILNPFIIIELTGNLHFEGVMLFFMLASLYLLYKGNWFWSAVLMGLSISVKLVPLMFLPLFWQILIKDEASTTVTVKLKNLLKITHESIIKHARFYGIVLLTVGLTFVPFLSGELLSNFFDTTALWFQKFEFNASLFYVIRWLGFLIKGYNVIGESARILPILVLLFILAFAFFRKNLNMQQLIVTMLLSVSFYFLFATTVHPWYVATPLLLCVFTKYRFPIVWSALVMLSYSAYELDVVEENLWLVGLEYIIVIGYAGWELFLKNKKLDKLQV